MRRRTCNELHCDVCGRTMIRTGSGYLSCPLGHGSLQLAEVRHDLPLWPDEALNVQEQESFMGVSQE